MKTAIQELIDELKDYKKTTFSDKLVTDYWILKAEKMLEREKEQIVKAFEQGLEFGFPTNGSNYFNKTYNQNK